MRRRPEGVVNQGSIGAVSPLVIAPAKSEWKLSDKGAPFLQGKVENLLRPISLGEQFAKGGNIIIALDQNRPWPEPGDHGFIEAPDRIRDRRTMSVDQQFIAHLRIGLMARRDGFPPNGIRPELVVEPKRAMSEVRDLLTRLTCHVT